MAFDDINLTDFENDCLVPTIRKHSPPNLLFLTSQVALINNTLAGLFAIREAIAQHTSISTQSNTAVPSNVPVPDNYDYILSQDFGGV